MEPLTALDILVILLVGLGGLMGVMRGFVTEVLSLLAWVAAVMALRLFYEPVRDWAVEIVGTPSGGAALSFAGLFLVTFIVFKILAGRLGARTRASVIGPFDRALGLGFGALKGLLVGSLLFLAVNLGFETIWGKDEARPEWMTASRTYPLMRMSSRLIVDFVEERRHADEKDAPVGYDREERQDLNELLDATNAFAT
mgnify:CR=1 FL=1